MTVSAPSQDTVSPAVDLAVDLEWSIRPSEYLETMDLGGGEYIVWNRFVPVPTLLNDMTMDVLRGNPAVLAELEPDELAYCRNMFLHKRLAYEGEVDPTRAEFEHKVLDFTGDLEGRNTGEDGKPKESYKSLNLSNDPCNVGCTYCMIPKFNDGAKELVKLGRKAPPKKSGKSKAEKLEVLKQLVDQYVQARLADGETEMLIGMGGGEMMAQWPIVKGVIEYATSTYPQVHFIWNMNSSLTLLSEEQAAFLGKHEVSVSTSIDGYKDNHDKYRTYHNGKGTFDDVLDGIELFNKHNKAHPITSFQGTIAVADEFDANKMHEFVNGNGFEHARMAPNLLKVTPEEGEKQADLMADLYIAGQNGGVPFDDLIFSHFEGIVKAKDRTRFSLFCLAMTNPKGASHVNINVSSMSAAVSCSFVPGANVSLEEVDNNIFDTRIWEQNVEYARERVATINEYCMGCEIAGACHGGCVLSGIDANNQINHGGCAYLRRIWRRLMAHLHDRDDRMPSQTVHHVVASAAASEVEAQ